MSRDNYGDERGGVMVTGMAIAMGNGDDDVMVMMAMIVAMVMARMRMMRPVIWIMMMVDATGRPPSPITPRPPGTRGRQRGGGGKAEPRPDLKPPARHPGTAARRGRPSKR